MTNISNIITAGLNNPDCSFFVGSMFGQSNLIKLIFAGVLAYFVFKVVDKLALDPVLDWVKKRLGYKK